MEKSSGPLQFATTRWSLVLSAAKNAPDAVEALATLCQNYWRPLYAYVRRQVADAHEAQDLTQAFFERLLEKNYLAEADPERGRFRAFLLTAFKHFLSKEWAKVRTLKRGGNCSIVSLDFATEDSRMSIEPADNLTPDQIYERKWAMTLLERVVLRLEQEWNKARKGREFQILKPFLIETDKRDTPKRLRKWEARNRPLGWRPIIYDMEKRKTLYHIFISQGGEDFSWSPDGRFVAAAEYNGQLHIFRTVDGKFVYSVYAHKSGVSDVAWAPDGRRLVTTGRDGDLAIWDSATGMKLITIPCDAPIRDVTWNPESRRLAAICEDGTLRIWGCPEILSAVKDAAHLETGDLSIGQVSRRRLCRGGSKTQGGDREDSSRP